MRTFTFLMIILLGILCIALTYRKNKTIFKIFGASILILLIFVIGFSSFNEKVIYTAPTQTQVNEFITKKSLKVLSVKEADNFTIILYENGNGYGEYVISVNQNDELIIDGVAVGGSDTAVSIGHVTTGKIPYITVVIHDEDILKKSNEIEITLKDGTVLKDNAIKKGTIILHHKETDKEQIPYEKLIIYDKDMNELYKQQQ